MSAVFMGRHHHAVLYISSLTHPLQVTDAADASSTCCDYLTSRPVQSAQSTKHKRVADLYNAVTFNGVTDGACVRLLANHPHLSRTTPTNRQRDGWGGGRLSLDWLTLTGLTTAYMPVFLATVRSSQLPHPASPPTPPPDHRPSIQSTVHSLHI